jgi:hypothetical protein
MEFEQTEHKLIVLIADDLPLGLAMNALSVIGVSMGHRLRGIVGRDVFSQDEVCYPGVINTPLPILKASHAILDSLLLTFRLDPRFAVSPFSCLAQTCRTYDEYESKLSIQRSPELKLSGLGVMGPKKDINKLTGSLPLYK